MSTAKRFRPDPDEFSDLVRYAAAAAMDSDPAEVRAIANRGDATVNEFSDSGLVDKLATEEVLGASFMWVTQLKGWWANEGPVWRPSADVVVTEAIRTYFREWLDREMTSRVASPERLIEVAKLQFAYKINPISSLVRGPLAVDVSELDAYPDLLNTPAGVVDLETGELTEHDPSLLLTKMAGCDYVPGASHPDWEAIKAALPEEVCEYLLDRLGQALTGYTPPDDKLLVCYGKGENGKSTLFEVVSAAVGDYAGLIPRELLLAKPGSHPTDLMTLRGTRLAWVEELPEERRLNVTRLKETVGTREITARGMRQDFTTFTTSHALMVNSNYLLEVVETDHGTWRRLELVKFPYTYWKPAAYAERKRSGDFDKAVDRRGDPGLRERARTDPEVLQAALADLVERAVYWYANRRRLPGPPAQVAADTADWRGKCDLTIGFFEEQIVADPDYHIAAVDYLEAQNDWLKAHGHNPWSATTLARRLEDHDGLPIKMARRYVKVDTKTYGERSTRPSMYLAAAERADHQNPQVGYKAWPGVRFRDAEDDAEDEDENP